MSKNPNTPLPLAPNTDDITNINLEARSKQNASDTEPGDFNMDVYATLDERNQEEINNNPTYANLPKRQNEKSFLLKCEWKIFVAGAVIVILMVQCIIIGLTSVGVFQGKTLSTINRKLSNLTENIVSWKADIMETLKILDIDECFSNPCQNG
ncbi:unnamed protein product, partial [Owenia fusiformis]